MKQNDNIDDTFLARWLNNELSDKELEEFKLSEDFLLYKNIAEKSKLFSIPTFKKEELYNSIQTELTKKQTKVRKLIPSWMYAVAAAVLVVFAVTQFINQGTTIHTSVGEQLAVDLPDGSFVKLNGQSSVSFNKKEWKKGERTLELTGEGYFKVKKGATFSVKTEEGTITVLGTQFNVLVDNEYLSVECYEGKVRVRDAGLQAVLTPGKGVKFVNDVKKAYEINLNEPNWTNAIYQYNAVPLAVVFKDLENVYKIEVDYSTIDTNQEFSGKLIDDNLEKALDILCKSMNINYKFEGKTIHIYN
ncbi:FecR family protein [Wenyingzhuangia sp. IMCC45574]